MNKQITEAHRNAESANVVSFYQLDYLCTVNNIFCDNAN